MNYVITQSPFSVEDLAVLQQMMVPKLPQDRPAGFGYPGATILDPDVREALLSKVVDIVRDIAREEEWPHQFDLGAGTGVNFLRAGPRDVLEPHSCTPLHDLDSKMQIRKEHQLIECYYVCAIEIPSDYSGGTVGVKAGDESIRLNLSPLEMLVFRADTYRPFMDRVIAGHHDMLWFYLCG